MSELEAAWRAYELIRRTWPIDKSALKQTDDALDAAYAAAMIPERERALVVAAMQAACCCCGNVSEAQVYCSVVFLKNPNRLVWNQKNEDKKEGE